MSSSEDEYLNLQEDEYLYSQEDEYLNSKEDEYFTLQIDEDWNLHQDELVFKIMNCGYYIYCCTLAIGLVGNITAVTVILCSKSFHNITGFYLLSLSAADLLTLLTVVLFTVFGLQAKFFALSEVLEYIFEWAVQTSTIVSIWTVTAFTVERYLAICHPFFVQSLSKKSRVRQIILGVWLIGALLALVPTAGKVVDYKGDEEMKLTYARVWPYIADVLAALFFFIPILMIVAMYVLIWIKLKKGSKGEQITRQQTDRADTRMLMMFIIIVAVFLLSWAPCLIYRALYMHMVISKLGTIISENNDIDDDFLALVYDFNLARPIQQMLFPLSSALNPIIFSLMSKKFRDALKALILNGGRKVFNWSLRLVSSRNNSNTVETHALEKIG